MKILFSLLLVSGLMSCCPNVENGVRTFKTIYLDSATWYDLDYKNHLCFFTASKAGTVQIQEPKCSELLKDYKGK